MIKIFFNNKILLFNDKISPILKGANVLFLNENTTSAINLFFNSKENDNIEVLNCSDNQALTLMQKVTKIVCAAGGKVFNKENKLLFIKRFNKWDLPKGWQEKGESLEECALREVCEECGLRIKDLQITKFITTTYHVYRQKEQLILKQTAWFEMQYFGEEKLTIQVEEDITAAEWIPINEISKVKENTYENIKIVIS